MTSRKDFYMIFLFKLKEWIQRHDNHAIYSTSITHKISTLLPFRITWQPQFLNKSMCKIRCSVGGILENIDEKHMLSWVNEPGDVCSLHDSETRCIIETTIDQLVMFDIWRILIHNVI